MARSRRLRKKLYLEEFAALGFLVEVTLNSGFDINAFIDNLIDMVESRTLTMGGGGDAGGFSIFVTSAKRYESATNDDVANISKWLESSEEVKKFNVGELVDANYGI